MKKSELRFALLFIVVYIEGNSLSAGISSILGIKSCATAAFNLGASVLLFFWVRKYGLLERYGLCKTDVPASRFLWYMPLIILASKNLWNGVTMTLPIVDTIFSICNMIGVGFLEELLFRGFLFRAVGHNYAKVGAVISSVSFGLGHAVNLINSRGMGIAENLWQIIFAAMFGFMCVTILYRGKTLWPCILTHVVFNITSVFSKKMEAGDPAQIFQNIGALLLIIGYTWVLMKKLPAGEI